MPKTFTFLHLSDIHFSHCSGDMYDLDQDLRNELDNDIKQLCDELQININAVFVTGDIAFSGKSLEYTTADEWLNKLCKKLGCMPRNVWVTPGNHDVDRDLLKKSKHLREIHKNIRETEPEQVSSVITEYCRDKVFASGIYQPIEQYNLFATQFGCEINPDNPCWEETELTKLDGEIELRLRGLNSVLISSDLDKPRDSHSPGNLVLGEFQVPPKNMNVEYITLCHHPINWNLNESKIDSYLNNRARIQLYGHTHEFQIQKCNGALRLNAGALHPTRNHTSWGPRYNLVQVSVLTDKDLEMRVIIFPRKWNTQDHCFRSDDGNDNYSHTEINLPLDYNGHSDCKDTANKTNETTIQPKVRTPESSLEHETMREVVYRYLRLPFYEKVRIAKEFNLLENEDENLRDIDKFKGVLERVKSQQLTSKFLEMIEDTEKETGN